jgi:hypothetical protein
MQNATLVRIQDVRESKEGLPPPGDPRLWAALQESLGEVRCQASTVVYVASNSRIPLPTESFFAFWLGFPGLHAVKVQSGFERFVLQVRRRGAEAHPLTVLLREQLEREGFGSGFTVWVAQQFEFGDAPALPVALNRFLSFGVKSGIFHPHFEEARVVGPGDPLEWARMPPAVTDLREAFQAAYLKGYSTSLRRHYRVQESRPREENQLRDIRDPLSSLLQSNAVSESLRAQEGFRSPLSFVASLPAHPDAISNVENLHFEVEKLASFYDRSVGSVMFRPPHTPLGTLEAFSPLPLNQKTFAASPGKDFGLYLIGPWDARNALLERRIEFWTRREAYDAVRYGELFDGEQDLVLAFVRVASRGVGWSMEATEARELLARNASRVSSQRAWLFWSSVNAETMRAAAKSVGVPVICLGEPGTSETLEFLKNGKPDGAGLSLAGLKSESHDVVDARWTYPEVKAPTYGFDKAAIYPDQYLLKVTARSANQKAWANKAQLLLTGERMRSVTSRRREAASVGYFRWTDGKTTWIESLGTKEGWTQVDPKLAGLTAVDAALRGIVALGGDLTGGTASLWVNQPALDEEPLTLEESNQQWAAYILALEGACQALRTSNFEVTSINGAGVGFPRAEQELIVRLRSKVSSPHIGPTLPGFRMTGEVLFAIGPRPAFVDAGSRLLPFVRVMSNNTMRLNPDTQTEIYKIVQGLILQGKITCIRPIGEGGIVEALGEMALWGGMGAQIRPNLPVIELFSAAPGRFVVGILPQEAKAVERMVKSEWLTHLGTTGGEKLLGLPISQLFESRWEEGVPP